MSGGSAGDLGGRANLSAASSGLDDNMAEWLSKGQQAAAHQHRASWQRGAALYMR